MDLLKRMLERDPDRRITSKEALNHPAFHTVLSKSPLISKNFFNADSLLQHAKLTEEYSKEQKFKGGRSQEERI
jgi:serine/threonine protein kinase